MSNLRLVVDNRHLSQPMRSRRERAARRASIGMVAHDGGRTSASNFYDPAHRRYDRAASDDVQLPCDC